MDTELKELLQERKELNQKIVAATKAEVGGLIAGIFEKFPGVVNFAWWNAPDDAFNDGTYPGLASLTVNYEGDYLGSGGGSGEEDAIRNLLQPYEDLLLELWDSGSLIIVYPNRVDVDYYDSY